MTIHGRKITDEDMKNIATYMDDEIREELHSKLAPCSHEEFIDAYLDKVKFDCDDDFASKWDRIHELRDTVKKSLETVIKDKTIRSSLEASVTLKANNDEYNFLKSVESDLTTVFIVSEVIIEEADVAELTVEVSKAKGEKCERCWAFSETVGTDANHPTLCKRCADILNG